MGQRRKLILQSLAITKIVTVWSMSMPFVVSVNYKNLCHLEFMEAYLTLMTWVKSGKKFSNALRIT